MAQVETGNLVETDHLARRIHKLRGEGLHWHMIGRRMMLAPGEARRIYFRWRAGV